MTSEPKIKLLEYKKRQNFFKLLVVIFILAFPSMIFYTTGHRLNFEQGTSIVTTGGIYITTSDTEVQVYLDGERAQRPRLFRSAYYIQNIEAGQHRVVVQQDGLYTWVKELPVDPYIVTEAAAFNMPLVPQLRPITRYETATGTPVFLGVTTVEELFSDSTSTTPFIATSSQATSSLERNTEYDFVASLFSTTTATTTSVFERIVSTVDRFRFATTTVPQIATSTVFVDRGNMRILERDDELYATWLGSASSIPYYFCVASSTATTTAERYGDHVVTQIKAQLNSTTTPLIIDGNRACRTEIRLDRKWQDVYFYDFFPDTSDLVLLQLQDGLYVTEIDDRAWQNTQQLYSGNDFRTVVDNNTIYINDGGRYFELITEIETN